MRLLSIIIFTLIVMTFIPAIGADSFRPDKTVKQLPSSPSPFDKYGFDAKHGFVGIISEQNNGNLIFQLFSHDDEEIFQTNPETDIKPFVVEMSEYNSVILLLEYINEGLYRFATYDYNGNLLVGPIETDAIVKTSPNGRFFYGINDFIEGNSRPSVYDSAGNLLTIFRPKSGWWNLTAINDTTLLFHDGSNIEIISVPEMTIQKNIDIPDPGPPAIIPRAAISSDGSHYTFLSSVYYVITDLHSEDQFKIRRSLEYGAPKLALSHDGGYLLVFDYTSPGNTISLFHRLDGNYLQIPALTQINKDSDPLFVHKQPLFMDDVCIVHYTYRESGFHYRSFLFSYTDQENAKDNGLLTPGFAAFYEGDKSDLSILNYLVNEDGNNGILQQSISIEVGVE